MASTRQELFLPVSGFVWLHPEEVRVVNHAAFQRLGRIYQLGHTHFVFRGATHKRIEHAFGTLQMAQRMIESVDRDRRGFTPEEARFVRLGALLHDIGHVACGHTLEDELGWLDHHDSAARLDRVFEHFDAPTLAALVDAEYARFMPSDLPGLSPSALVRAIIAREEPGAPAAGFRLRAARDLIANTICADLLDYLHRDWYHIGKPRPWDERLFQYMELRGDEFVLALGSRPRLRTDAVSNILDLLEWRYQLADVVLFHRTKLAAAAMLDRALVDLWGRKSGDRHLDALLPLSDEQFLAAAIAQARHGGHATAQRLLESLDRRHLFQSAAAVFHDQLPAGVPERAAAAWRRPAARAQTTARLEREFRLPAGSLALYCPAGVREKIAGVRVAIGDEIAPLADYEAGHQNVLTGGHLEAQLRRARRLWRAVLFLERGVPAPAGLADAFLNAIHRQD